MKTQTYKLEFCTDEKLYSIFLKGKIAPEEIRTMLESARNCLYEKMAENIQVYLEQHHLEYLDFVTKEISLRHEDAMNFTNHLLHSATCDIIDEQIGETDIYYGVMDHQQWIRKDCCEGCYYVVKRTPAVQKGACRYIIIGQTFNYHETVDEEQSCFAIRTNESSRQLYTIDSYKGEPVIPTFGCVDIMGLLLNIDNIRTARQVEKIAVK